MKLNVAVVGMGYWGRNLVRVFNELDVLHTICDSDPERETSITEQYPGVYFSTNYDTVLNDEDVDAVVLATPAVTHHRMTRQALSAGKHVLVEKPLAMSASEGEELVALAEESANILMVGHILRYHPAVVRLKELIQDGALGKIRYLYSNRLNIGKIRTEENILESFAPHDISVMLHLVGEQPTRVGCQGAEYLTEDVLDVTTTEFSFPGGVRGHIYVSWLHPFKEQRLVIVGSKKMALFDDTAEDKLVLFGHRVEWKAQVPTAVRASPEPVPLDDTEPLSLECQAFLDAIETGCPPPTDAREGVDVLRVLDACKRSLDRGGAPVALREGDKTAGEEFFVHETAVVEEGAEIGAGTKVWHFSHVMSGARIGRSCTLGQNVNVDGDTVIGDNVKIQNNVSVYSGVVIEDDVFLGPSCVLTNVSNPRSQVERRGLYEKTVLRRGCSIGANATIVCGHTVGPYAFVGAGAVVTRDVPAYALMLGNPARKVGWMSRHGHRLGSPDDEGIMTCPESGLRYREVADELVCLDLEPDEPLPPEMTVGTESYPNFSKGNGA